MSTRQWALRQRQRNRAVAGSSNARLHLAIIVLNSSSYLNAVACQIRGINHCLIHRVNRSRYVWVKSGTTSVDASQ